ncbi:hypothetical protein UL82_00410 [Corynebacterium kutscheri]|uniref:Gram-positive cocci surface proteins LPxTG domain-containing protein n=2 Tax=Corynebacterium kutscheri TaxID=35755 RepID=A0A0F6TCS1_9CORY|nr:hypothetical protein UL82_00410 [Corynebacterium kutscheri]VEH10717.1 LPxTG domain-containing protein [Corynebacterium kutscheri]
MNISVIKRTMSKGVVKNPWLVVLFVLLLVASSIPLATHYTPHAAAQEAPAKSECTGGRWENIKWKDDSPNVQGNTYVGPSGFAEVEFDWKAEPDAKAGDKFEFDLPPQLKAINTGSIALKNYNGEIVATGEWVGNKFIVTLTGFQERHFDVQGKVFLAVAWNTSSSFNGQLDFTGCGSGRLSGKFEKREGGEFHDDSKIGEYRGYDEKNKVHTIQWSVGIDPKKHQNEATGRRVVVTDTAPKNWKFACSGKYADGYAPVYVSSFVKNAQGKIESYRHAIYAANGQVGGGTRYGFTDVTQDDGFNQQNTYLYELRCSENQVSVTFPYGLSEAAAPVLTLTAYTEQKPQPGSIVTNKATIDSKEVQGHVRFPTAGGLGFGRKGGFTVEKIVLGTEEDKKQDYKFDYECKDPQGKTQQKGSTSIKDEEFRHIDNLEKGWICTVKENVSEAQKKGRKLTVSWVAFGHKTGVKSIRSGSEIEFTVDDKFQEAIHVVVTNKFESERGQFTLFKEVKDQDARKALKGKEFTFDWKCTTPDNKIAKEGRVKLGNGKGTVIDDLPLDSYCTIKETDIQQIEGYTHSLKWLINGEPKSEDPIEVIPRSKDAAEPLIVTAINEYTPVVPPVPPTTETTTEPVPPTTETTTTTEPAPTTETTTTTEPTPTTSSSTMIPTTEPTPTTATTTTTEPAPTTSSTTTTTEPVPTTSTTQPVPTTSSSTPTTTTTTSSEPIVPTTTHQVPPIIPIPIPIPIPPAPQPVPPVTTQVTPPVPSTPVTQSSTPAPSGKTQPGTGRSGLANTGASVNLIALLALLLAMIGGLIVFYTRGRRRS